MKIEWNNLDKRQKDIEKPRKISWMEWKYFKLFQIYFRSIAVLREVFEGITDILLGRRRREGKGGWEGEKEGEREGEEEEEEGGREGEGKGKKERGDDEKK